MSFVHGLQGGKEFLGHLDLVFKGSVRVIGIIEGREGGFVDDFLLEGKVRGFVGVEFIQLLYGGRGQGSFSGSIAIFGCFGCRW